jgi:small subunit ribosomal protein S16
MLTIRLRRIGRTHKPQYRIVVAEKHKHATKKIVEMLGFYDPISKDFKIDKDRAKHWLDLNTEMSDTVKALFVKHSIIK